MTNLDFTGDPPEVTDERIYEDLKAYADAGMIEYVLPTEPLGEQWIVGWNQQILKFVTKEGIVGFLTGYEVEWLPRILETLRDEMQTTELTIHSASSPELTQATAAPQATPQTAEAAPAAAQRSVAEVDSNA